MSKNHRALPGADMLEVMHLLNHNSSPGTPSAWTRCRDRFVSWVEALQLHCLQRDALAALVSDACSEASPSHSLDRLFETLHALIPYDRMDLALLEREGTYLRIRWTRSSGEPAHLSVGYAGKLDDGPLRDAMGSGSPWIVPDLPTLAGHGQNVWTAELRASEGMRSWLACPIMVASGAIGLLSFSSRLSRAHRADHADFASALAVLLGVVVERGRHRSRARLTREQTPGALDPQKQAQDTRAAREPGQGLEDGQPASRVKELVEPLPSKLECRPGFPQAPAAADPRAATERASQRTLAMMLEREWAWCRSISSPLSMVLIEFDGGRFHNRDGNAAGNDPGRHQETRALLHAFQRIPVLRGTTLVRYHAKALAILLPATSAAKAVDAAESLRREIEGLRFPRTRSAPPLALTASLGVSSMTPSWHLHPCSLLLSADEALHQAKKAGGNRVWLYSWPRISEPAQTRS